MILGLLSNCSFIPEPKREITQLKSGDYVLDPKHTTLLFKARHLGLSTYVGRFNEIKATLQFFPKDIQSTWLNASIQTASVDTNDENLEEMLKGKDWFHSIQYPEAIFKTKSVDAVSENEFLFSGELEIKGIVVPIEMIGIFHGGATNLLNQKYTLGFSATGQISRSDFDMDKYSGFVGDSIDLEIYAEFIKR